MSELAQAVLNVVKSGFHPTFAMVYDEFWRIYSRLSLLLSPILGNGYQLLGDFWLWCIKPGDAPSGWQAHRDNEFPNNTDLSGLPNLITIWVPFTDATPSNSCIHVLPTSLDPNFPGHLERSDFNRQSVKALPAKAGTLSRGCCAPANQLWHLCTEQES